VTRTPRHAALAAFAAVLLAGTAGCSGDDDPGQAQDEPTSSSSSPSSPTESTSGSATQSSSPAAPSVTPASGIQLSEASSTVRAPAGWEPTDEIVDYASAAADRSSRNSVDLVDSGDLSGGASLDIQATSAIKTLPKGAEAARLPDVMLDGVAAFHIHYTVPGDRSEYDTITTVRNGRNVGLDFVLEKKNAATNPDLVASVLATFAWTA
jgi:hypothetical protein